MDVDTEDSAADVLRRKEKAQLKQRIDSLAADVVERTGKLLRPMLESTLVCLFDLIQVCHCPSIAVIHRVYQLLTMVIWLHLRILW